MKKFGFKIFSTNLHTAPTFVEECIKFASFRQDMFIEIMIVPESPESDLIRLKELIGKTEVRIHAPHNVMGFDAGNKELESQNRRILAQSQKAADLFDARTIVVHAGCGHGLKYIRETARQFKVFNDERLIVENLPHSDDNNALHGSTAEDIKYIMEESGCGFCFDFSHAVCAALSLNMDMEKHLKSLFDLNPALYHMCDGHITEAEDFHMHFGSGDYPLKHFLNDLTDKNAHITMETGNNVTTHNQLWIDDYNYLKSLLPE